jgi:hypothetical protein
LEKGEEWYEKLSHSFWPVMNPQAFKIIHKLTVFVHYVFIDVVVKEEMLDLMALKEITGDIYI